MLGSMRRCVGSIRLIGLFAAAVCADAAYGQSATLTSGSLEDPKLRAEAVRLVERANLVSTPGTWPPNEMRLRYRFGTPPPGFPAEGEYVSSVGGPGLRRQQWDYGPYHFTQVRNGQVLRTQQAKVARPAQLELLTEVTPIYLVRFDDKDLIRGITTPSEGMRCIAFETVSGDRVESNEICVDESHGWMLSIRTGNLVTRNSNFFPFERSFLPGHIERWRGSQMLIAVDETVQVKSDYPPDFFDVPRDTNAYVCPDFRRAYEVSTPQPEPGNRSIDVIDIRLIGVIGTDGHVSNLKPLETSHPELNEEAMKLVSTWTYEPAQCRGAPAAWSTTFTLHFKGR
jgi:hypothetical protein